MNESDKIKALAEILAKAKENEKVENFSEADENNIAEKKWFSKLAEPIKNIKWLNRGYGLFWFLSFICSAAIVLTVLYSQATGQLFWSTGKFYLHENIVVALIAYTGLQTLFLSLVGNPKILAAISRLK